MSSPFIHNDLRFLVTLLYEHAGVDVRFMVPGFEKVQQATIETVEAKLEEEDTLNADHMERAWLYMGRALESIGMREGDGYDQHSTLKSYYSSRKRDDDTPYIALARTNAEKSKGHLGEVPLRFEAVPKNWDRDATTIRALNLYRDEVLSKFTTTDEEVISDGHDFGTGIWFTGYRKGQNGPNARFLRRRRRQGQPINWEQYQLMQQRKNGHEYRRVDTFKVIRDRRAKGEEGMVFENPCHTMFTIMETISVTEAMMRYPQTKGRVKHGLSEIQLRTNPVVHQVNNDDIMTTIKHTWVKMPVRYVDEFPVDVGGGIIQPSKELIDENVWVHYTRLEDIGIVDVTIDEYDCGCPYTMFTRRPSKSHCYGIGAYKDMHAPEWTFNRAFTGKFRWFNTSSKRTTFIYDGVLTEEQQKARKREGQVVVIDPKALPQELRNKTMDQLVHTTDIGAFPSIYDNLENDMIRHLDRIGDMASEKRAYTGRQQALLNNSEAEGMSPIVKRLESSYLLAGTKFYDNIMQFDEKTPIRFTYSDPVTDEKEVVELNTPYEIPRLNPETMEMELYTYAVKNSLRDLDFDTIITARGIVPVNPTEKRHWVQDMMSLMLPLTETPKGVLFLGELNKRVLGGMFTEMIEQMKAYDAQASEAAEQNEEINRQLEMRELDRKYGLELEELKQNAFRLMNKAKADDDKNKVAALEAVVAALDSEVDSVRN